ncbi:MAG TPA: NAD(P)-binding protein [Thermodesulfobacteriota bacterium]
MVEKPAEVRGREENMTRIAILGAGMAGFGASNRLLKEGVRSVIYEKKPYHGGHTASFKFDSGFIFDDGPHISFTKNERIQKIFAESVNNEFETIQARTNNYWQGHWIKHPVQCNLYGLPKDLIVDVLRDFIYAQNNHYGEIKTYADWLYASFGKTFSETFPMEYGLKYHTTKADNMSTDWLGQRVYRPNLDEVSQGALSPVTPDVHYIDHFRYPSHNGFVSYLDKFPSQTDIRLNHGLIKLDPRARKLYFENSVMCSYEYIISSIPLPDLIPLISGVPADVIEASQRLSYSTVVVVNIGVNREDISEAHWTYFYDPDFFFTRLNFPHMLSPNNVPHGAGSIQAEVYYSKKYRPLDRSPGECIHPVISDLKRCGLIRGDDKILYRGATIAPYANVIFDLDRADALATVHGYLDDIGVIYCGRYGEWGHHWTDESFISGENAAQRVLDSMCPRSVSSRA